MKNRVCPHCKIEKPLTEFNKNKSTATGLSSYCKISNRKVNSESNKRFYAKRTAQKRAYYQLHPEINRQKTREYNENKKQQNSARWRAKKFFDVCRNDVSNDITISYLESLFTTITNCQCCGKKLSVNYEKRETRKYRSNPCSPSIDRVNNEKGYSKSNIAVICWECNFRKTDLTLDDLKMFENYIKKYGDV